MTSNNIDFPTWLQNEMETRGWSQSDLARAAGLSRAVINKLLNHKTYPKPTTLEAIARALKISPETAYRFAGLLPKVSKADTFATEISYKLSQIKDPQRKKTVLRLLDILIEEENNE